MKTVHVIDYGVGNIGSLSAMLESLGFISVVTSDAATVRSSPLVILPGVGSAATAIRELAQRGIATPLAERHAAKQAIVGICLGAQLLFDFLEEGPGPGLGFLGGTVSPLRGPVRFNTGWCRLEWAGFRGTGLATGLNAHDSFFFNHQYVVPRSGTAGTVTVDDRPDIPALYTADHLCGIQFHPEKSQGPGRRLMQNVLRRYHGL